MSVAVPILDLLHARSHNNSIDETTRKVESLAYIRIHELKATVRELRNLLKIGAETK